MMDRWATLAYLDEMDMKDMTQKQRILKYLRDFGSITPLEALRDLGIMRLGARIWELIRDGWPIFADTECAPNRYGQTTRYARYRRAA